MNKGNIDLNVLNMLLSSGLSQPIKNGNKEFPPLYALSKNGNVRTYCISVTDMGDYALLTTKKRTTDNGIWTTDTYEYYEGVNIGKANETTYLEQAINEATSLYKSLFDKGFKTSRPTAGSRYNTDANGNIKPMLAISYNERKIKFPCLCQPKYDGVRCTISEKNGEIQIISRRGKSYNIPHLLKWASEHRELLPLDGELYNHKEITFQQITSAVKKLTPLTDKIRYVVYDRPIPDVPNNERWAKLISDYRDIPADAPTYLSTYILCNSIDEIWDYHDECVEKGYEGAIVRNVNGVYDFGFKSSNLIKVKAMEDDEFKIVDVIEASGRDAGTAIFVCECEGGLFNVKPQGSRELRAEYFERRDELIGKMVTIQYQELSDGGIPRFPSAKAIRDYE